ncbi:MAG: AAA family ATPase [Bacteroidia bacterium]|nr:AAA family ATPase [Bacteroidia bacterium]
MTTPKLIGLCGISGSGKTHILEELQKEMPVGKVSVLSFDNYYKPAIEQVADENGFLNFDLPEGVDDLKFISDLRSLIAGETLILKQYNFNTLGAPDKILTAKPADIIFVEGIFIFHFEEIRNLLNKKIYLEVPDPVTLERRLKRDNLERGLTEEEIHYQWQNHVLPGHIKYVQPYIPTADLILHNSADIMDCVIALKEFCEKM